MAVSELCRQNGFSDTAFREWRARLGGMQVGVAKPLREIETENGKLQKPPGALDGSFGYEVAAPQRPTA